MDQIFRMIILKLVRTNLQQVLMDILTALKFKQIAIIQISKD
jgi:hypothetical protein